MLALFAFNTKAELLSNNNKLISFPDLICCFFFRFFLFLFWACLRFSILHCWLRTESFFNFFPKLWIFKDTFGFVHIKA